MNEKYKPEGTLLMQCDNSLALSTPEGLEKAALNGVLLEGRAVLCDDAFNLTVDCGCMKGIIPKDEAVFVPAGEKAKDIAIISRVGKPVCFKVMGFDRDEQGNKRAVLSRRAAQGECIKNYVSSLIPGDIINAKITHLEHFGAFADIGSGIISMLPIDCMSVSRISHPRDRLDVGDSVRVVVSEIQEDNDSLRVCLSLKELLGTWQENASRFSIGQTAAGIVRSVEDYGIFVELLPNLAGLAEVKSGVSVGDIAAVYIKNIIPDRMKVKLVIVDSYKGDFRREKIEYFVPDSVTSIDVWNYSPPECSRVTKKSFACID